MKKIKTDVDELEDLNDKVEARTKSQEAEAVKMADQAESDAAEMRKNLKRKQVRLEAGCRIAGVAVATLAVIAVFAVCAAANLMHRDLAFLLQALTAVAGASRIGFLSAIIKII